jgi:hypothetical protein
MEDWRSSLLSIRISSLTMVKDSPVSFFCNPVFRPLPATPALSVFTDNTAVLAILFPSPDPPGLTQADLLSRY